MTSLIEVQAAEGFRRTRKAPDLQEALCQHLAQPCIRYVATISPKNKGRYGRIVGDVECQGRDVVTEQARSGMAWFYAKYGKGYEHLQGLEAEAR